MTVGGSPRGLFDLTGRVVVVTGGNSGLGLAFARGVARQGADVAIWARSAEKNARAKAELEAFGTRIATRQVDVSVEQEVVAGFAAVMQEFGRVDCVFANAGAVTPVPSVLDLSTDIYSALLNTSLHGAFVTLREGARCMVERAKKGEPGGSLVACGSLSIFFGMPNAAHYAAAKSGLAAITRSFAADLGQYGIRANVLAPGYIKTGLTDDVNVTAYEEQMVARTPMRRLGQTADIEGVAAYLASDASAFHTGDTLVLDGGRTIDL
jgi:NAD(P)-dependent dehydrogenase (short-subunit alcohol dehydrogenase family)